MKKTIVFDFDKTLTIEDTNLSFFIFNGKRHPFFIIRLILYTVFRISCRLKFITNSNLKNIGLFLFYKNVDKNSFLKISQQFSKKIILRKGVNDLLHKYKKMNHNVVISSASFEYYVSFLYPDFKVIGTTLEFKDRKIKVKNHNYKSLKMNNLIKQGYKSIDVLYTDSKSDLSIASKAKEINLVINNSIIKCDSLEHFLSFLSKKV